MKPVAPTEKSSLFQAHDQKFSGSRSNLPRTISWRSQRRSSSYRARSQRADARKSYAHRAAHPPTRRSNIHTRRGRQNDLPYHPVQSPPHAPHTLALAPYIGSDSFSGFTFQARDQTYRRQFPGVRNADLRRTKRVLSARTPGNRTHTELTTTQPVARTFPQRGLQKNDLPSPPCNRRAARPAHSLLLLSSPPRS